MLKSLGKFKLLLILIVMVAATMMFGHLAPVNVKAFFYAISLSIKEIIVFLLPIIIFAFLWNSLINLQNQAGRFVILLLALVFISNFTAILTGYTVGVNILPFLKFNIPSMNEQIKLIPTWDLALPQIITTKIAMTVSIILGLYFAFKPNIYVSRIAKNLNKAVVFFLKRFFVPVLPLFIFGFLFKLEQEKILTKLMVSYGRVLLLVVSVQLSYIFTIYMIAANFSFKKFWEYIKNMLPASITAFSTTSSAATLPVTTMCTEKNLKHRLFAKTIVPATCNIHTLGSAISLTIIALATIKAFNIALPDFKHFIDFAIYYALAKYAVAGVPGGVIVVAAPLLELYLDFTPEMIGIVTALYLLFDPFGTTTNVTCNGAFAIIFSRIYKFAPLKKLYRKILSLFKK